MNIKKVNDDLKPLHDKILSDLNWYQSKAIESLSKELYHFLLNFYTFDLTFNHHVSFGEWYHYRTFGDCQMSAREIIEKLFELQREHGNTWVLYINDPQGNPLLFIEFDGYMFNYDIIEQGDL